MGAEGLAAGNSISRSVGGNVYRSNHPERDQCGVTQGERGQPVQDMVVGKMNQAVNDAQCDISPGSRDGQTRGASGDIQDHANYIEEHRHLEQVHVVPVRNTDIGWHRRGLPILEVIRPNLTTAHRTNPHEWNEQQDQEGPSGERKYGMKHFEVPHFPPESICYSTGTIESAATFSHIWP